MARKHLCEGAESPVEIDVVDNQNPARPLASHISFHVNITNLGLEN